MATKETNQVPSLRALQRHLQQTDVCADCGQQLAEQHYVTRFGQTTTVCADCCDCAGGDP